MENFEVKPRISLIDEPSDMKMIIDHKGKVAFKVKLKSAALHSCHIMNWVNTVTNTQLN